MEQIKWRMTEEEFRELKTIDHARTEGAEAMNAVCYDRKYHDNFVAFEMGKLWVEFEHTLDPDNWLSYPNVYALGIDDGYGATLTGKIPYALTDIDFHVRTALESETFENFKRACEQLLTEALKNKAFAKYKNLAKAELGNWD